MKILIALMLVLATSCKSNQARIPPTTEDLVSVSVVNIYQESGERKAAIRAGADTHAKTITIGVDATIGSSDSGGFRQVMISRKLLDKVLEDPDRYTLTISDGNVTIVSKAK